MMNHHYRSLWQACAAVCIAGAFGVALSARSSESDIEFEETVAADAAELINTRPTAVNRTTLPPRM